MTGRHAAPEPVPPTMLTVVSGQPTDEELAALVAVVAARSAAAVEAVPPSRRRSAWRDPGRAVRRSHEPGPGGWRRSGLPR